MFKPPKGIKYGIISESELKKAMDTDERLMEIAAQRIALEEQLKEIREDVAELKDIHKKSFWGLYKAEAKLCKIKIRKKEKDIKLKNSWTQRVWELFKVLKFKKYKKTKCRK